MLRREQLATIFSETTHSSIELKKHALINENVQIVLFCFLLDNILAIVRVVKAVGDFRFYVGMNAHAIRWIILIRRRLDIGQLTTLGEQWLRFEKHVICFDRLSFAERSWEFVNNELDSAMIGLQPASMGEITGQTVTPRLIIDICSFSFKRKISSRAFEKPVKGSMIEYLLDSTRLDSWPVKATLQVTTGNSGPRRTRTTINWYLKIEVIAAIWFEGLAWRPKGLVSLIQVA